MKQYLYFNRTTSPGRKTSTYDVMKLKDGFISQYLGVIKWHSGWRQYVFEPLDETIWSSGCLKEITEKIDAIMAERRTKR